MMWVIFSRGLSDSSILLKNEISVRIATICVCMSQRSSRSDCISRSIHRASIRVQKKISKNSFLWGTSMQNNMGSNFSISHFASVADSKNLSNIPKNMISIDRIIVDVSTRSEMGAIVISRGRWWDNDVRMYGIFSTVVDYF